MQRSPRQIVIADDCFQHINVPLDRSSQVVVKATEKLFGRQVLKHINLGDYLSSRVPSLKGCSGQKPNDKVKAFSLKLLAYIMQFLQRLVRFFVIWKYYHNLQLLLTLVWKEYYAFQSIGCLFFGIILHTQQLCF
ncbi:hypothetical protein GYH30_021799 [Glycine max]|nr:hypothetical protein GYH30_021799 [Glycine max]